MATAKKKSGSVIPQHCQSPLDGLAYRALVFARENGQTTLYFVAGAAGGPWAPVKALATAHKTHGGECFYCKKDVAKGQATIDHVEPEALGGKSHIANLVIACKPCNCRKGHVVIDAFNPKAGEEWLNALLKQIQQRLASINPPSSPPPPSPGEAGGP